MIILSRSQYQSFVYLLFSHFVVIIIIITFIVIMILLFFFERDYDSFENFLRAIQKHDKKKSYAILIKRFKQIYFSNVKRKCVLMCEREDITKRKLEIKFRKIENKKCECAFKVNVIFNQNLNV